MPPLEQLTHAQKWDTFYRTTMAAVDGLSGALKIFFALDAGAVVLFVNLLAKLHAPRLVLLPLDLSIFAFGLAAILTVPAFLALAEFHQILAHMLANEFQAIPDWQTIYNSDMKTWEKKYKTMINWMGWSFSAGVVFAGVFVILTTLRR